MTKIEPNREGKADPRNEIEKGACRPTVNHMRGERETCLHVETRGITALHSGGEAALDHETTQGMIMEDAPQKHLQVEATDHLRERVENPQKTISKSIW